MNGPKVLLLDIETSPILANVWDIWDQNIGLNQIEEDWTILSWSAKWLGSDKILYMDNRHSKNSKNDKKLLKGIWSLLNECDVVISHNGKSFDSKKLNARFAICDMRPPSSYKHIDTLTLAKKHFKFTSNKLEYLSGKLCKKYKKYAHQKYPGFSLWTACLSGDQEAWKEMERYNKMDVLALEELYHKLMPWDNTINFNVYSDSEKIVCHCGSEEFQKNGFFYSSAGRYQRYKCSHCGSETRSKLNLLTKEKRATLRPRTTR